jgi:hypothetical protein
MEAVGWDVTGAEGGTRDNWPSRGEEARLPNG